MNRVEAILGPMGILILAVVVVGSLLLLSRARGSRRSSRAGDTLDMGFMDDEHEGDEARPSQYANFAALLKGFVLPLHEAHPGWERLDGAYGVPGRPLAWFDWNGTRYSLNGETQFAPLLQAHQWLAEHPGEDPLVIHKTKSGAGRLTLRPEIGWTDQKALRIETG